MDQACLQTKGRITAAQNEEKEQNKESALEWFVRLNGKTPTELAGTPKTVVR